MLIIELHFTCECNSGVELRTTDHQALVSNPDDLLIVSHVLMKFLLMNHNSHR